MKKTTLIFWAMTAVLTACSGEQGNDDAEGSSEQTTEETQEPIEEKHSLEIVNFASESAENESFDRLPFSYNAFDYSKAGALYDEASKTLSIYFANFENPESTFGMCCGTTESGDQRTLSFIIKHDADNNVDQKMSFINYTDTSNFIGLNMVDKTMTGDYEMKDGYVEGHFTYLNDKDSTAFIKTEFKLNLDKE